MFMQRSEDNFRGDVYFIFMYVYMCIYAYIFETGSLDGLELTK